MGEKEKEVVLPLVRTTRATQVYTQSKRDIGDLIAEVLVWINNDQDRRL